MTNALGVETRAILLVEDTDDRQVVRYILNRHQASIPFCVLETGGVSKLLPQISVHIDAPDQEVVGILADANTDLNVRWREITQRIWEAERIKTAGLHAPQSPDPNGTIIDARPRVGVWLMPNNTRGGELEDFVAQMIPDGDAVWRLSRKYIDKIPDADRKFPDDKSTKAQLYAWLAARKNPRLMGLAIRDGDLSVDGPLCQKFVDWLTRLFQ